MNSTCARVRACAERTRGQLCVRNGRACVSFHFIAVPRNGAAITRRPDKMHLRAQYNINNVMFAQRGRCPLTCTYTPMLAMFWLNLNENIHCECVCIHMEKATDVMGFDAMKSQRTNSSSQKSHDRSQAHTRTHTHITTLAKRI